MSKVIVTFEKNWRGYAAGETAGFDAAVAESLVEAGYAIGADKPDARKGKSGAGSAAPAAKKTEGAADPDGAAKPEAQAGAEGKP
ncbi:hypothetical protein N5F23_00390 [Pseudomonas sichuanensis]|uniref:hypothetical protein n=1 Tax=Pseudomonas sichuanensis TaxID=2213015 RepID=UPI002449A590|nr:hypothetical protein [Pseudomonas sichuanensis]MDH0730973.1 hypothetical protein [Pseudomonas sichuanensis]MDH1581050.1 hypothetical protein [Pseudomonas sichuanensis]MDH1591089.1 hypothetical protein [Pseudomonas sichuanensis]MDH1596758.1 hypothetical protein [Pseudomonas sichuanensis]